MAAQFNLLDQQILPDTAIFGALVGEMRLVGAGEFGSRLQDGTIHGVTSRWRLLSIKDEPRRPGSTVQPTIFAVPAAAYGRMGRRPSVAPPVPGDKSRPPAARACAGLHRLSRRVQKSPSGTAARRAQNRRHRAACLAEPLRPVPDC